MLSYLDRARKKRANGEAGFTLIELLVVVVILGILIAIAIPVYLNYRKSANDKAAQSDLRGAISTLELCNTDGGYPTAVDVTTTISANGTMTGCSTTGATSLKKSGGTLFTTYTYTASPASYIIVDKNSGGTKWYCYNSATAGALTESTTAITTC